MLGSVLMPAEFAAGDIVDVTGLSMRHGYLRNICMHGQSRGPMAHGSRTHRRPGSLGAIINMLFCGCKLPGRMGNQLRTMQNLLLVAAELEHNVL